MKLLLKKVTPFQQNKYNEHIVMQNFMVFPEEKNYMIFVGSSNL
jgi:hypothetical protein